MVAILSLSSLEGACPYTGDIRIHPNPSLDTSGPFLPRAIFVIVVIIIIFFNQQHKDQRSMPPADFPYGSIYLSV